ncbi:MarR family winged helix-turn-helix transcriptional regulator [Phocaeicola barnesiae]|uniref:MarR family winged helix-turn-helix transcriptional regulator n=1 Tax=Phocaeicola barnesiae TaxID=376804 RepID=UPI001E01CB9B|nr:MarR family transcriptional regulator [Phocaeicola barnesiae]HJG78412.1 MarR family transcriptional regulator [Phocaeicola barnesiae]
MTEKRENATPRDCILQLIRTRMASRQAMQRLLKNSNAEITFEMLQTMSCLWNEQGISQQVLAERTAKDKACLTSLMTNLERKGYVCRREDPKDRRNKLVYLTDEGEAFHQWIAPTLAAYYERLEEILGTDKLKQTEELLKDLQHAIESY